MLKRSYVHLLRFLNIEYKPIQNNIPNYNILIKHLRISQLYLFLIVSLVPIIMLVWNYFSIKQRFIKDMVLSRYH